MQNQKDQSVLLTLLLGRRLMSCTRRATFTWRHVALRETLMGDVLSLSWLICLFCWHLAEEDRQAGRREIERHVVGTAPRLKLVRSHQACHAVQLASWSHAFRTC